MNILFDMQLIFLNLNPEFKIGVTIFILILFTGDPDPLSALSSTQQQKTAGQSAQA